MQMWSLREGCGEENCLILSGGDIFISAPISSHKYENEPIGMPVAEVMQAMGYDAVVIGNHELDFELQDGKLTNNLAWLRDKSKLTLLSANYVPKSGGDFALPYKIIEKQGLRIGVVGLGTRDVVTVTSLHVAETILDLSKLDYEKALQTTVEDIQRKEQVDVLILVGHVSPSDLQAIRNVKGNRNKFVLFLGGHDQKRFAFPVTGTESQKVYNFHESQILEEGGFWNGYIRIDLRFKDNRFVDGDYTFFDNPFEKPIDQLMTEKFNNPKVQQVADIVRKWYQQLYSDPPIGTLHKPLENPGQAIVNGWYEMYATKYNLDVALSNAGGFRGCLPAGKVYEVDVRGVLPFDNSLVILKVSGDKLRQAVTSGKAIVVGLERVSPITDSKTYTVLTNSFIAEGGDGFPFKGVPTTTVAANWQDPTVEWFRRYLKSSDNR